ncbi:MAG: HAD family hydrolase [SAR324 cluster bacterium]|nr:HAD family hydrolase [SAR324 cluster bacterium]
MKNKAILLDRDGVINHSIVIGGKPYPPPTMAEFQFTEAIQETLEILKKANYILVIFTNQPDVGRKTQSLQQVEMFHQHIQVTLPIDQIYACFHDNSDQCDCRKPKPGMLYQAQKDWNIDFSRSYVVGDRWRDIDAGNEVGCQTIWIDYGYDEELHSQPDFTVQSVQEISKIIYTEI